MAKKSTSHQIISKGSKKVSKEVEKKLQEVAEDAQNFKECLNIVASTKEGQYVLSRLIDRCGQNKCSLEQLKDGSFDSIVTDFNEGRRSVWLFINSFLSMKNKINIMKMDRSKICKTKRKIQDKS